VEAELRIWIDLIESEKNKFDIPEPLLEIFSEI
jgi:hypothetical protein